MPSPECLQGRHTHLERLFIFPHEVQKEAEGAELARFLPCIHREKQKGKSEGQSHWAIPPSCPAGGICAFLVPVQAHGFWHGTAHLCHLPLLLHHPQSTCAFLPVAVTHKRPTVPHSVPQFITQKTTPVTLASSTSQTSVSREASPASSPEVPLTKTSPSPSSLPVTSTSSVSSSSSALPSTRLRPSHPGKAPLALPAAAACSFQLPPFSSNWRFLHRFHF